MIDWTNRPKVTTPEEIEEAIADETADFDFPEQDPGFREAQAEMIRKGILIDSGHRRSNPDGIGRILWMLSPEAERWNR